MAVTLWGTAVLALWIPAPRERRGRRRSPGDSRSRLLGPFSELALKHLSRVGMVILPVLGSTVVAIAFVHGQLRGLGTEFAFTEDGFQRVRQARDLAFTIVYASVGGLFWGGVAFAVRPEGSRGPRTIPVTESWLQSSSWPWRTCGGPRRWLAQTFAMASGFGALAVVLLAPTLVELLLAVLDTQPMPSG